MTLEKSRFPKQKTLKQSLNLKMFKPDNFNLIRKAKNAKHRKALIAGALILLVLAYAAVSSLIPLYGRVLTLQPREFTKGFTEEGTIVAAQEWPIFNPVEGKLLSLSAHNGNPVKKGQILLEMDTRDLNFQLESLKAQLSGVQGQRLQNTPLAAQIAQQKLIVAQAEKDSQAQEENLSRMKSLFGAGAISQSQYEDAQRSAEKTNNFLEQQQQGLQLMYEQRDGAGPNMYYTGQENALQAQIDQIQEKIAEAKIAAPQDGVVKDLSLKEGTYIPLGQQLLTVFQDHSYKVESYVLAGDALDVKPGSPVDIIQETGSGKNHLSGRIETVDPSAVEKISPLGLKENRVKVTISLQASSPVVLGSTVDVQYTTVKLPSQLLVPKTAVFPYQQGYAVWLIKDGRAKLQPVQKGLENDQDVIIAQGLSAGAAILQDIDLKGLKEGKRITAKINN